MQAGICRFAWKIYGQYARHGNEGRHVQVPPPQRNTSFGSALWFNIPFAGFRCRDNTVCHDCLAGVSNCRRIDKVYDQDGSM